MAGDLLLSQTISIPFSGKLQDGLTVLVTFSYGGYLAMSVAMYTYGRWTYASTDGGSGVGLSNMTVNGSTLTCSLAWPGDAAYYMVIEADNFPL
jgi:hypothetical protein